MVYFTHNNFLNITGVSKLRLLCHAPCHEKLTNTKFEVIQLRMGEFYATEDFAVKILCC